MIKLTSRRAALVLAGSAIALVGGMLPAQAATTGWRSVAKISIKGDETLLTGVDAVAKGDAWAVGGAETVKGTKPVAIIEHWTGKSWRRVTLPAAVAKKWNTARTVAGCGGRLVGQQCLGVRPETYSSGGLGRLRAAQWPQVDLRHPSWHQPGLRP